MLSSCRFPLLAQVLRFRSLRNIRSKVLATLADGLASPLGVPAGDWKGGSNFS